MKDRFLDKTADEIWFSEFYTQEEREMAEATLNTRWDSLKNPYHKLLFIYTAATVLKRQHVEDREDEREERRLQKLEDIALEVEGMRIEQRKNEFAEYMKLERERVDLEANFAKGVLGIEASKVDAMKQIALQQLKIQETEHRYQLNQAPLQKQLPAQTETMYHTLGQCILGDVGPRDAVKEIIKDDGEYQKCRIVAAADDRSVLGWQFINAPRRKEAGCPLYESRNISNRLFSGFWPPLRHETCDLADGQWHKKGELYLR